MELLTEAVQEARNISHGLMSRVLTKFGLSYAITEIVNNINTSKKLKISFKQNIDNIRFNEELEMGLYRTLQELINNIIKHSQANNASVQLIKKENKLLVQIKDDGVGIKRGLDNNPKSNGIGLKNMKSRIEYLGGKFTIDNKIKKGTKINIELVLQT
jgi:signal transduction histidine kinase